MATASQSVGGGEGVATVRPGEWWLWGLALGATVLDIVTTVVGLSVGLRESNPFAVGLMHSLGPLPAMILLKALVLSVGVVAWVTLPERYRAVIPLGLALPWLVAGFSNTALILFVVLGPMLG